MSNRKTTADYFAEALSHCGAGVFIHVDDAIRIMQYFGWSTESPTPELMRENVRSRVYKQMRHAERHPEDSLPIDCSKSRLGLYAHRPKVPRFRVDGGRSAK